MWRALHPILTFFQGGLLPPDPGQFVLFLQARWVVFGCDWLAFLNHIKKIVWIYMEYEPGFRFFIFMEYEYKMKLGEKSGSENSLGV